MFYLDTQTNTRYYLRRAFSYGSLQYSQAAATHETFTTLGFTQVIIASRPDSRFYIVVGPDNTGAYSSTPRDLAELKTSFKREQKATAHNVLRQTDWYVVRLAELGVSAGAIPADVTTFRAAYRTAAGTRCDEIDATTTVQELETLIKAPALLYDEYGNSSVNPAALTQFPDSLAETYSFGSY